MRIPDAYFEGGLGQRIAQVVPAARPDASGDMAIGQAIERLGTTILHGAVDANEYQGRIDMQAAHDLKTEAERLQREQEAELKQQAKEREDATAKREYLNLAPQIAAEQQAIIDNPDIPPEEYPGKISEAVDRLANTQLYSKLNEHQKNLVEPMVIEHKNKVRDQMFKTGQKEINDQSWAEGLATADNLVNDPTRSAQEKIAILKDDNFFAETGRLPHEIEAEREKRIAKITENEIAGTFNTKGPVEAKGYLEAKNRDDGSYTNLPELHLDKREAYIAHADEKIKQMENEARREAREQKSLQDQQTHNLFESMKTMLNDGYPLPAKVDVQARMSFKGTKYEPLYAAIKEKANSLEFKTDLINKDPLLYYARSNGYNIPPVDTSNPATIRQQIQQRIVFSSAAQKALNLPYRPDFLAGEQQAIGHQLEALDGTNRVKSVKMWSDILGSQNMVQFAKQVSGTHSNDPAKNGALGLEIALAASGKETAAQWVATGRDYLKTVKIAEPARKAQNATFDAMTGDALKGLTLTRENSRNAVNAAFVYLAKTQGMDVESNTGFSRPNIFSDGSDAWKLYNQAFRAVVGDTTKINNKTTIVPTGMTEDGFKNSIKLVTPEIVAASGGVKGFTPDKAAELLRGEATLWESGEGVYSFQIGGKQVKTNSGQPFKLKFGR
jgi:hypothetical protein